MSELLAVIQGLRDRGVHLWVEGGELRYGSNSGGLSPAELRHLRAYREEILSLLANAETAGEPLVPMQGRRTGPWVMSFAQQRLWFLFQMEGATSAYNIPVGLRLRGELREGALQRALDMLVERHETLRTRFETEQGEGYQIIDPSNAGFHLRRSESSTGAEGDLSRVIMHEVCAPFDLRRGPTARGHLIRLAPTDHLLLLTLSHINCDGWSLGILARDLSALYRDAIHGEPCSLEPLQIQYADYAQWQRRHLFEHEVNAHSRYWQSVLAGGPGLLELPTDRRRPAEQRFDGDVVPVVLDSELTASLKAMTQRHGITLYMAILAAWAIVLSRLSGQEDVVIGTPTANRTRPEIDGLIGLFVNALALRLNLSGNPTIKQVLHRAREAALGAQEHQEFPFEKVVDLTKPERSPAYTPLFQVMFAWQNNEPPQFDLPGLDARLIELPNATAKYDLTLDLAEAGGRIVGVMNYATALFDRRTVERHVEYLRNTLGHLVADVSSHTSVLSFIPAEERRWLLIERNATASEFPDDRCIHELFEEQVARTPHSVAVVDGGRSITYAALNGRANQLARHLIGRGAGPGKLVALCAERSAEAVVGLLGILKSGAAYVPLDPEYPIKRLEYMLEDAAPVLIVTQSRWKKLAPLARRQVIALDTSWGEIGVQDDSDLIRGSIGLGPRDLAFVIYTSGSTGTPKGAMNEHRGMVNRLIAQRAIEAFSADDVCCQKTSLSFVDHVFETFGPLCNGVPLVIVPTAAVIDGAQMAATIERERITQLTTVPSLARAMLEQGTLMRRLADLRKWTLSGEEVRPDLLQGLQRRLPHCEFIILYGSSEVSSDACYYRSVRFEGDRVPIGWPVPNVQVYILDRHENPVPIGVVGQICVGGVGVGRGYLNRPELTQESFVPDPYSADAQARLYKTGDLGRWRADGLLECLGRSDGQVKIRGMRLEMGEVESQLARNEHVKEAAVVVREDAAGEKRLVAYMTLQDNAGVSGAGFVDKLRAYMRAALPDHMVPSAFVALDTFPRTPNGKLDRRSLPAPQPDAYLTRKYESPRDPVELGLAEIWGGLLTREKVGRHDNFFELGGHSLHVLKLTVAIVERFGVRLAPPMVFQAPVLRDMAQVIESLLAGDRQGPVPEVMEFEEGAL